MEEKVDSAKNGAIMLFTCLAIGVVLGVLFAPKSGKETRKALADKGENLMEMGKENVSDVIGKVKDLAESGKKKIEEVKDIAK